MREIENTKKQNRIKALVSIMLVVALSLLFLWNDSSVSEAAWHEGEPDSNNYEVFQLTGPNDASVMANPVFRISGQKVADKNNTDEAHIEGAVVKGIGNFEKGDTFDIVAIGSNQFKGQNLVFTSSNSSVATVRDAKNGSCTVTIVGPGLVSLGWSYTYQKFYDEDTTESITLDTTDESGTYPTRVVDVTKRYIDLQTITGSLLGEINPKILSTTTFMEPNDTLYLKTNVPDSNPNFYAEATSSTTGITVSKDYVKIGGFWYILLSANGNSNQSGYIDVQAMLNYADGTTLRSDNYRIIVVDSFKITPGRMQYNAVDYSKSDIRVTKEVAVSSSSTSPITWELVAENGMSYPILNSGQNEFDQQPGLFATINGKSVMLTTTQAFFDNQDATVTAVTFTIRATQKQGNSADSSTYVGESVITVTRPVQGIEIMRPASSYVINSEQELYRGITYSVNGNNVKVPIENFTADSDVLIANLSGLGDRNTTKPGTNGDATVSSFSNNHIPYNSKVTWTSTNSNVVAIQDVTTGAGYSQCSVLAVGAGRCVVKAVSEDGSYVASVEYIVRPYPKTVTMKDKEIITGLGSDVSKQVTIAASVTSGNEEDDKFLDDTLFWEIISMNSTTGLNIAEIDQKGVLTFTGPGTVVVSATSAVDHKNFSGYAPSDVCTVTIEQPVEKITIINKPKEDEPLMTGQVYGLKTRIDPSNATNQKVKWYSSNSAVATVDADGKVTAKGPGEVQIRVETESGAKYDTCKIIVCRLATSVVLDKTEAMVRRGNKLTLFATVLPKDTTDQTVTWTSSDKSVATVTGNGQNGTNGVVTGLKVSKNPVIITATTSNGKFARCYVTVTEPVTGIKISPTKKTIYVGDTFTIKKTLYPLNNDSINENVTWTTSDAKVATVDKNGKVTPKAGGKCTITCTTEDGGYIAKCVVTVKERVSSIVLNRSKLTVQVGKTFQFKANVLRSTATNKAVKWKSSKKNIATISSKGKLKAKKVGKTTVTCTAKDGSGVKAQCTVYVVRRCTTLKLNKSYITLIQGYQYKTLKATVKPKNATNKKLVWSSSDPSIVSVNKNTGTMFTEGVGTAYVTVRTTDGSNLSKTCRVKVIEPVPIQNLIISQSAVTLINGQNTQLEVRTVPTNATASVKWMSDDESVATVSKTGYVKTKKPGTCVITAYTQDESGKSFIESQCTITVIQMNPSSIAIEQYDQYTLTVDGADGTVTWNSSNANIVKVANGQITGVKPGTATVYATYNGKKVSCTVTVKKI